MTKNKFLFLDIDGVLNTHKAFENHYYGIKYALAKKLNRIIDNVLGLQIVISSSWRYLVLNGDMNMGGLTAMLNTHGIKANHRIAGVTRAETIEGEFRISAIRDYVVENNISRWLVLDDVAIAPEGEIVPEFIQTYAPKGLTAKQAKFIIRYFNDPSCTLQKKPV